MLHFISKYFCQIQRCLTVTESTKFLACNISPPLILNLLLGHTNSSKNVKHPCFLQTSLNHLYLFLRFFNLSKSPILEVLRGQTLYIPQQYLTFKLELPFTTIICPLSKIWELDWLDTRGCLHISSFHKRWIDRYSPHLILYSCWLLHVWQKE